MLIDRITVQQSRTFTATFNSNDQENTDFRGVALVLDISAISGTSPTLDVKLQRKDPISGKYIDITGAAFAQQTATGTLDLVVYPGITATSNRRVNDVMPRDWRVVFTIGGTTPSVTFSLAGNYLP